MLTVTNIVLALILVNAWTFVLFGWDKLQAERFQWRVAEATLLKFSIFGGLLGAYAGRALFRHKTLKQPFNRNLRNIGLAQLIGLTFVGVFIYAPIGQSRETASFALLDAVYYPNCDWAQDLGAAPIKRGEPGYRSQLDADNDGIACEPYRGRK